MPVSQRRIEANRRNAQFSTGPTTAEGKARSSRNGTRHGLTASLPPLGAEARAARAARVAAFRRHFGPRTEWETWLIDELADCTLKLGRIGIIEIELSEVAAIRAGCALWDADRRAEVEAIGAKLGKSPARVVADLRRTPHGCDWLIERWASLADLADTTGWTDEHVGLAHDLLGTSESGRTGPIGRVIDERGLTVAADFAPALLARTQIEQLRALRDLQLEADDALRAAVAGGAGLLPGRDAALLRRYEGATRRHLRWLMGQIAAAGLQPQPADRDAVTSVVVPSPPTPDTRQMKVLRTEPSGPSPRDEPKPRPVEAATDRPASKRPDPAKLARKERKARRKRGRKQHQR